MLRQPCKFRHVFFFLTVLLFQNQLNADSFTSSSIDLRLADNKVHQLVVAMCSLVSNHESRVQPKLRFHIHHWEILENSASNLSVKGACAQAVDLGLPVQQLQKGEDFNFMGKLESSKSKFELRVELTHGVFNAVFVRESIFNKNSRQLELQWQLQSVDLTPSGMKLSTVKMFPLAMWYLEQTRALQQTNYVFDRSMDDREGNDYSQFHSLVDLHRLALWTTEAGKVMHVNMATNAQFQWGQVPAEGNISDAVFFKSGPSMWGCSNFLPVGRGELSSQLCHTVISNLK